MRTAGLALLCTALAMLGGCGGSDDGESAPDAAATIGERVISETEVTQSVDKLFPHEGGYIAAFGPPRYPRCVQVKRESDLTAAEALKQCKLEFGVIRAQALSYLLRAEWVRRESERRKLPEPDAGSLRERVDQRLERLQAEIPVTDAAIKRYGDENSMVYEDSERRIVDVLQTRGRARALRAHAALRSGRPWPEVIDEYGARPLRRTFNGHHEVREASAPHDAFGRGMFSAPLGKLVGPVQTLNGQFIFLVRRVSHVGSHALSAKARTTILHALQIKQLEDRLHTHYAAETSCARRYRVPEVPQCM
jgi:hypothetical protein